MTEHQDNTSGTGGMARVAAEAGQVATDWSAVSQPQLILPPAPAASRYNLTRVCLHGVQSSRLQIAAQTHPKRKINIW